MHPELVTLPGGISIKTYGFCMMLGFLSAVWMAMRRAERVKANADRVLDLSFLALVFGVGGARVMYVIHYWQRDFAGRSLLSVVDIRQGGLEFLGGLLGAIVAMLVYLMIARQSIRLYLDILTPGAMWGLAFGRIGCFFNGCCFGGLCVAADGTTARFPWAVQFPYGSPAHVRQWEDRRVSVPAELITPRGLRSDLLQAGGLAMSVERREGYVRKVEEREQALADARAAKADRDEIRKLEDALHAARDACDKEGVGDVLLAQKFPSRRKPDRESSVSELEDLAAVLRSLPVHPTQLYASIHAFALSGLLSAVFYRRKRHGVVFGLMFALYPIGRILLEFIRTDNPHDVGGLTISQFLSVSMVVVGFAYLFVLYKFLPERSPAAEAARATPDEEVKK